MENFAAGCCIMILTHSYMILNECTCIYIYKLLILSFSAKK